MSFSHIGFYMLRNLTFIKTRHLKVYGWHNKRLSFVSTWLKLQMYSIYVHLYLPVPSLLQTPQLLFFSPFISSALCPHLLSFAAPLALWISIDSQRCMYSYILIYPFFMTPTLPGTGTILFRFRWASTAVRSCWHSVLLRARADNLGSALTVFPGDTDMSISSGPVLKTQRKPWMVFTGQILGGKSTSKLGCGTSRVYRDYSRRTVLYCDNEIPVPHYILKIFNALTERRYFLRYIRSKMKIWTNQSFTNCLL